MEYIYFRSKVNGINLVVSLPWSLANDLEAHLRSVDGHVVYSMDEVPSTNLEKIALLKLQLDSTDYQAIKFSEGQISAEDYDRMRSQRQQWRDEINQLEDEVFGDTVYE